MDSIDRSGNLAFDSSRYSENDRLSAYDAYIQRGPGSHFKEPLVHSLSSDNANYNKVERFLGENLWLTRMETSGHTLTAGSGAASGSDAAITLVLLKTCTMELTTTKGTIKLGPGDAYLRSNSGTPAKATIGAGTINRMFFPKSQFGDLHTNNGEAAVFRASDSVAGIISSTFSGLENDLGSESKASKGLLSRIARDLVYNVATDTRRSIDQDRYQFLLERGKAYISTYLHEPDLNASAIAKHLNVSRATLYRAFEPAGGVRSAITRQRLDAARRMLQSVPMQRGLISNVAYSCGFASPELFSRAFKAGFGISPSEFSERNFGT